MLSSDQRLSKTKLVTFLSKAVGEKLLSDDINYFLALVRSEDVTLLESINPSTIVRHFFPTLQLSKANIDFLLDCKIIFRSQNPLYSYQHSRGERMRYEHSMSFLMLFVLVNFGLYFRIMSVPNATRIGLWQTGFLKRSLSKSDDEKADYTIEIVPTALDISVCLDSIPVFKRIADQFTLPILDKSVRHSTSLLLKLRNEMAKALKYLSNNLDQTIINVHKELLETRKSTGNGQDVIDQVSDDKSEFSLDTLQGPLTQIFKKENQIYVMKNSGFGVDPRRQEIFTNFFNIFFILHLCSLAKVNENFTAASAQNIPYKNTSEDPANPKPLPADNYSFRIWLYGQLTQANDYPIDQIFDHMEAFKLRLTNRSISPWSFSIGSIGIIKQDLEHLFLGKNLELFRQAFAVYNEFENVIEHNLLIENMSSVEILDKLLNPGEVTESHRCYIRKIQDFRKYYTPEVLDKEFNIQAKPTVSSLLKVRPATLVLPSMPIDTYSGDWRYCSGVVILTSPGNVEMVGYKRPANSNRLAQPQQSHTFGFPYSSESILRYQGGKPSYNESDFVRRMNTIYARSKGQFPDLSRKEYYAVCLFDYDNQSFLNIPLKQEDFIFTADVNEVRVLLGIETFDKDKHKSDNFKNIFDYYLFLKQKLTKINCLASIKQYYLALFPEIIRNGFKNGISFIDSLHAMQMESKISRQQMMKDHCNAKFYSGVALPYAAGLRPKYSVIIGKNATSIDSNEALLQGLVISSKFQEDQPVIMEDKLYTASVNLQQYELQKRSGNYAAIYVDTTSIVNAIILYDYILRTFKLDLPFAIYTPTAERKFKVGTAESFKSDNGSDWEAASKIIGSQYPLSMPKTVSVASSSASSSSTNPSSPSNENTNNPICFNNEFDIEKIISAIYEISLGTRDDIVKVFSLDKLTPDTVFSFSYDIEVKAVATNQQFKLNETQTLNTHCTTCWNPIKDCVPARIFPQHYADEMEQLLRKLAKTVELRTDPLNVPGPKTLFSLEISFKNIKQTPFRPTQINVIPNISFAVPNSSAAASVRLAVPHAAVVLPSPNSSSTKHQRTSSSNSSIASSFGFFNQPQSLPIPTPTSQPTLAFPIGPPPPAARAAPSSRRKRKAQ